jgi:hypothetical protein
MATASAVYPVTRRFIGVAKEATPGTAVTPTYTYPMTKFTPVDKITYLKDAAWRNAMADLYNLIEGVEIGELDMGGPFFGDGAGYGLVNILGDYWQAVNGTAGTATTVATGTPYTAGATTLTVTSPTGFSTGTIFVVGTIGSTAAEVRTVGSIAGSVITLNAPMYQNHSNPAAVTPYSPYTTVVHNFSLLNGGTGAGGWSQAQPVTQTWTDYTGVTATVGARAYAYTCFSELVFTGNAIDLLMWSGKASSLASAISGSTPTATISAVKPQASWVSTLSVGGTQVNDITEWEVTLSRKVDPIFTNSGQQSPFTIARGEFGVTGKLTYNPAMDETGFLEYLNNTQPTLAITAGNGLAGANLEQLVLTMQVAAYDTGALSDSGTTFGYEVTIMGVANTTNIGPSGGYSPIQVALTNAVINY